MSKFKKQCPEDLRMRIMRALCVGPLCDANKRLEDEMRDFMAQKLCALYMHEDWTKEQCLKKLCEEFGLDVPQYAIEEKERD